MSEPNDLYLYNCLVAVLLAFPTEQDLDKKAKWLQEKLKEKGRDVSFDFCKESIQDFENDLARKSI